MTENTTASGAADWSNQQYLQQLAKHYADSPVPEIREHHRRLTEIARGLADAAPVAPTMVDMVPPATSRDRWMYEQGRLAERDPRTSKAAPVAPIEPFGWVKSREMTGWAKAGGSINLWRKKFDCDTPVFLASVAPEAAPVAPAPQPAPVAEDAEIRKALDDAATALETIGRIAGRDRYMLGMMDVRLYAAARAKVAREALAAQPEGGA